MYRLTSCRTDINRTWISCGSVKIFMGWSKLRCRWTIRWFPIGRGCSQSTPRPSWGNIRKLRVKIGWRLCKLIRKTCSLRATGTLLSLSSKSTLSFCKIQPLRRSLCGNLSLKNLGFFTKEAYYSIQSLQTRSKRTINKAKKPKNKRLSQPNKPN